MAADRTSHELLAHFDRPKKVALDDFEWVDECAPDERGIVIADTSATNWGLGRQERPRPQPTLHQLNQLNERDKRPQSPWDHIDNEPPRPTRGVGWVLCCAIVIAALACSATVLTRFAYVVAAENALNSAARAAAVEATLPRANYRTVWATVERRLESYPQLVQHMQFNLLQNGEPVGDRFRAAGGDQISIELSAPASAALPNWLARLNFWQEYTPIRGRAELEMPGRKLRIAPS